MSDYSLLVNQRVKRKSDTQPYLCLAEGGGYCMLQRNPHTRPFVETIERVMSEYELLPPRPRLPAGYTVSPELVFDEVRGAMSFDELCPLEGPRPRNCGKLKAIIQAAKMQEVAP